MMKKKKASKEIEFVKVISITQNFIEKFVESDEAYFEPN